MKSLPFALLLSVAFCLSTSTGFARLGDDRAALEKRFGKGKEIERSGSYDQGLWSLFDAVLSFEKSGIVIVAGLVDDRCEAIVYEAPPTKGDEAPKGMNWTEIQTLLAKNSGNGEFKRISSESYTQYWTLFPEGGTAKIESDRMNTRNYIRLSFFTNLIFEGTDELRDGSINSDFLDANPPKKLEDF